MRQTNGEVIQMKTIRNAPVRGRNILLRVDYNLPVDVKGDPTDDARIVATIPTIEWLLRNGVKQIIILTHWGRPKGKVQKKWCLKPIAQELARVLKNKNLVNTGRAITKKSENSSPVLSTKYYIGRNITMLENLRFDPGEEKNSKKFAKLLAAEGDIYVNDAFAVCHRAHASLVAITKLLPAFAGLLLADELKYLHPVLYNQEKPFVAIIGGAKVKDKIPIINTLRKMADKILIGGKTANEYFEAMTEEVEKLEFPSDGVDARGRIVDYTKESIEKNPPFDIGPDTIVHFKAQLKQAKTVFWNGSLGKAEEKKFRHGSNEIARFIANMRATTIVSGGDTAQIIDSLGLRDRFSFVSTGGGAASEYLIGKKLPGLIALEENGGQKPKNK